MQDIQTVDAGYTYSSSSTLGSVASTELMAVISIFFLFYFVLAVIMAISMWKLFTKAGKPGWAAIVPIYNNIVMLQIIGRPLWWLLVMMFVPFFGIWLYIVMIIDFAKAYGKSTGFAVLMMLFPFIVYPILAFSKDVTYVGPVAQGLDGFTPAPDRPVQVPAQPVMPQQ